MTLREALATGFSQLHATESLRGDALRDAAYLLRYILAISHASLLTNYDRVLTAEEQAAYEKVIARRRTQEPIQYITGDCEFYGLPLHVGPAVLIPRSATEHLVEAVLEEVKAHPQSNQPLRIVDVGTGSGAIAIALACHLPHAQITALDLSPKALEVAVSNAQLNSVSERIRFLESDLLGAVAREPAFDVVASNPPYVPDSDRENLHPQIRYHEPELALYAGSDGLDIYRRLLPQARALLLPNGLLAMEIGFSQRDAMVELLADWNHVRLVDDLKRIPRVVVARKP